MTCAFVFPGQGSQSVGMGKELYEQFHSAQDVFDEIDSALNQKLSSLIFSGDEKELNLTENTQPALMAVSMAVIKVLENDFGIKIADHVACVAGHSLGEYSALTAAGSFSIADCAVLLKTRGRAMQKAVPVGQGAMAAVLGLEMDVVQSIANEVASITEQICATANDNSPGQIVISGHTKAVEKAAALAAEKGARRSVILPVSAPFHCALMQPAAEEMRQALSSVVIQAPVVPVINNVTAEPTIDPNIIRTLLVEQVTGMVRWRETVLKMVSQSVEECVEIGAGKVLSGLNKRISSTLNNHNLSSPQSIEDYATLIKKGS